MDLKNWIETLPSTSSPIYLIYYGEYMNLFKSLSAQQLIIESQEIIGNANILWLIPKLNKK